MVKAKEKRWQNRNNARKKGGEVDTLTYDQIKIAG